MAERSENVITWNVPNVITIWLMIGLLWVLMGIGSHLLIRKKTSKGVNPGVVSDNTGSVVTA